jgi:MFS family permease
VTRSNGPDRTRRWGEEGDRNLGEASSEEAEKTPHGHDGTLASLRLPNYRLLWLGQTCHAAALWMEQVARPWLVLLLTDDDPVHVGGVIAVQMLPQLLFGLWAGVVADWFDRRGILVWTKGLALLVNAAFAFLLVTGAIALWHVYVFAFARGTLMAFDQPARQSLIATLVPVALLTNAVALMSSTQNVMRIFGVTVAGALISAIGVSGAWVAITVVLLGALVATVRIDLPPAEPTPDRGGLRGMSRDLVAGARFAAHRPEIRGVLLLSAIFFAFGMAYMQVFLPLFARFEFGIGALGLSILSATAAVGALLGALVIANRRPVRLGAILPVVCAVLGLSLIGFAAAWSLPRPFDLAVALPLIMAVGLAQTTYFSLAMSTLLSATPEEMRGRVISLLSLDRATMALGASVAGFGAAVLGTQAAQGLFGLVCVAAGLLVVAFAPGFRAYRIRAGTSAGREGKAAPTRIPGNLSGGPPSRRR